MFFSVMVLSLFVIFILGEDEQCMEINNYGLQKTGYRSMFTGLLQSASFRSRARSSSFYSLFIMLFSLFTETGRRYGLVPCLPISISNETSILWYLDRDCWVIFFKFYRSSWHLAFVEMPIKIRLFYMFHRTIERRQMICIRWFGHIALQK